MSERIPSDTIVIGGGVVGSLCAYYLSQSGHRVTIVDAGTVGGACSHGNCGYVCPSHVLPLAVPGAVRKTLRAMLSSRSPFYIKPRVSPDLWSWLWRFMRCCNPKQMMESAHVCHELLQSSLRLYEELIAAESLDCEWERRGLLFVFRSDHEFHEYEATDRLLRTEFGVAATPYDGHSMVALEPALRDGLGGGWHYEGDCHLRPDKLMSGLRSCLERKGVRLIENCRLVSFDGQRGMAQAIETTSGRIEAQQFVVATGAWTPMLNRDLGCRIPIQPGKGYSITMPRPHLCPRIPLILEEHRVAITPMRTGYRIGSTMEFAGYDATLNRRRLGLLKEGASVYLREPFADPVVEEWYGWRPMTYDSRPIIDRSPALQNVWIAAGHSMLGLSMATATGKLVRELIDGDPPHVDPKPLQVHRAIA